MHLIKQNNKFIAISTFEEKHIPKEAGFRFDGQYRSWWTDDISKAAALIDFASDDLKTELAAAARLQENRLAESRATDADIEIPALRAG